MTRAKIKAVIFDCDGTLVDSETLGGRAMFETAARYGCTLDESTLVHACLGSNMASSITLINQHSPVPMPDSFAPEVRALMAEKFKFELMEVSGAKALLAELQARGIPFAMATNGPRAKAELTLGLTGLLPFFQNSDQSKPDRLFSAYEHDTFKPDPQLFLLAAAHLGVLPAHCAAVEDSWSGLKAAVDANMQTFSMVKLATLTKPLDAKPTTTLIELLRLPDLLTYL
jgi:HAD superfamily hydrolase (TIGR01509 family)